VATASRITASRPLFFVDDRAGGAGATARPPQAIHIEDAEGPA
jgi:hypothetical protein